MRILAQNYRSGALTIEDVPSPVVQKGMVLVRNAFSLISPGTERMKIEQAQSTLLGKARARPDQVRKVMANVKREGLVASYRKVMAKLDTLTPLGYSSSGVVIEAGQGVEDIRAGDRVACAGAGYANHAETICVPRNLCVRVTEGVAMDEAACTTLGAIALHGIRQADAKLGEKIGVVGLGLLGQLAAQLLKASGCEVFGVDIDPWAVEMAVENGVDAAGVSGKDDLIQLARDLSHGRGLDAVLVTASTKGNEPIELAERLLRDRGRVVSVGMTKMDIPRNPYYTKELDIRISRSYGPGRYDRHYEEHGHDYPIGYVRWTERRNMEAIISLLKRRAIRTDKIITHRFDFSKALNAYEMIQRRSDERYLGILLEYRPDDRTAGHNVERETIMLKRKPKDEARAAGDKSTVGVSFIGAGSFAKSVLIPHLKKKKSVQLRGILTADGLSAKDAGSKFGFVYATSDPVEIIGEPKTDLVMVATQHNTHAAYVVEAMKRGKAIYVEKPLCLNAQELEEIAKAYHSSTGGCRMLMVGFNRRFSPMARSVADHFSNRSYPLVANIRINAGYIIPDHWTQDSEIGGGRIVGEVCHFIDLARFWIKEPVVSVYAQALRAVEHKHHPPDTVAAVLHYTDGSLVNLVYLSNGDTSIPKEYYELFGGQKTAILEDFRRLTLAKSERRKTRKTRQDKGHGNEMSEVIRCVLEGRASPIPFEVVAETSRVTFAIIESIHSGNVVAIAEVGQ